MERFLPFFLPSLAGIAAGALPLERFLPPSRRIRTAAEVLRGATGALAGSFLSPGSLAPLLSILAMVCLVRLKSRIQSRRSLRDLPCPPQQPPEAMIPDPPAAETEYPGRSPLPWTLAGALLVADPLLALSWAALALALQSLSRHPGIGPALAGFLLPLRFLDLANLPGLGAGATLWVLLLTAALPHRNRARKRENDNAR